MLVRQKNKKEMKQGATSVGQIQKETDRQNIPGALAASKHRQLTTENQEKGLPAQFARNTKSTREKISQLRS